MVDMDKITSDEAYALLSTIPSDGESEAGESDNSDSDPDEDFLAKADLVEPAIVVFCESEGEDREGGYGEDRQDEADDDTGQNINGSNSAHDSDCSEDDIPLSLVRWSKRSFTPDMITFTEDLGPKNVAGKSIPIEFFQCFFDDNFVNELVYQTNLYCTQSGKRFEPTTLIEMRIFLAINILMGIKSLPSYRDYWSSQLELRDPYISSLMNVNRFGFLLTNIHLNDNSLMPKRGQPNFDVLYKIRPFIDGLKSKFQHYYMPTKEQSIDESMVKYKGRSAFKQYMPKKPIKRGYKVWVRADLTGYICNFEVYTGKAEKKKKETKRGRKRNRKEDEDEEEADIGNDLGMGERVIHTMTDGLEGKGYHMYFDNFFTTERVMRDMYKKKIYCCGTVRQNRKKIPKLKTDKALARGEWDWSTRRAMLSCVKWKDKRAVTVASTIHNPEENAPVGKKEKDGSITQINCPISVTNYRRCMGGVDRADMHKSYYAIDRKSRKWWHRLFWHFADTALVNAFILYKQSTKSEMKIKDFRLEIVTSLVGANSLKKKMGRSMSPLVENRYKVQIPKALRHDQAKHLPEYGTSRRCAVCSTAKNPHRTRGVANAK